MIIDKSYKEKTAPVYEKYPSQTNAQRAFLEVKETGTILVYADGAIGNSTPINVWDGLSTRWQIPNDLSVYGIDTLIEELTPLLEEFFDNLGSEWNGSKLVGVLTERGKELEAEIESAIETYNDEQYRVDIWEAIDWLEPVMEDIIDEYKTATDKESYLKQLEKEALEDNVVLTGIPTLREWIEDEIE